MRYFVKNTVNLVLGFALILSAMFSASGAQTNAEIEAQVDQYLNAYEQINQFSGAVLIARDGDVLVHKGYGMANYEWGIPSTPETKFRIASLTKSFTAMAIMMLEEQGSLSIDDPLSQYFSDNPIGQDKLEIYPKSETDFFLKLVVAGLSFVRNETGEVDKMLFHQGLQELPAEKVIE